MTVRASLVGLLLLGITSLSAGAFEQTEVLPKTDAEAAAAASAPTPAEAITDSLDLSNTVVTPGAKEGPTISLPGIGKIGTLPKFDFGLELLYGEGDHNELAPQDDEPAGEDLRIRGTVKHKF